MITLKHIQDRLIEAIKHSGMSQTAIAKELGVSQQAISSYIKGQNLPALDTLANLCKLLDVDANYILCLD